MLRNVESQVRAELVRALDKTLVSCNDWRRLAKLMGYQTYVDALQQSASPAEGLFSDWETKKDSTAATLMALFDQMERDDLRQILEKSSLHRQDAQPAYETLPVPIATASADSCSAQFVTPVQAGSKLRGRGVQATPVYTVCQLLEGYSDATGPATQNATGSSTLFKGPVNIVADTGTPWDKHRILARLHEFGMGPNDVGFVVCTHGHSDHIGNLNLFQNATMIVSYDVSREHSYTTFPFRSGRTYAINGHADVIPTPGHTECCVSVVVRDTDYGTVVAAGDLFECEDDLQQPRLWQDFSEHIDQQMASREKVLQLADWIIPGHGRMFRNPRLSSTQF